jgi:hypothetical protein
LAICCASSRSFSTFRLVKRAEYLIQLRVEALGEDSIYSAEIRRLEFFQPDYYRDLFPPREVQELVR